MTVEKATALLTEWQRRLGLMDWTIELHTDLFELSIDDAVGCTSYIETSKTAYIEILSEKAYGDRVAPYDFEKTLVHELLHLKFCFLSESDNDLQNRITHQLIDDMARALVNAKRRK